MQGYREIRPEDMRDNVFTMIGSEWMLVTAGAPDSYNTMTASWGGLGVLWSRNIAICFIRPQRYTYEFIEQANTFTLSFFDDDYKKALELCGTKSGRDIDKASATGLTPIPGNLPGTTTFSQARMVLECDKIYFQDLDPANFLDPSIAANYPTHDYHRMYLGEIRHVWVK